MPECTQSKSLKYLADLVLKLKLSKNCHDQRNFFTKEVRYLSLSSNRGLGLTSCYLSINIEADSRLDQLGYPTNEAIKKSIFLYCNYTKKVFGVLGDIFRY